VKTPPQRKSRIGKRQASLTSPKFRPRRPIGSKVVFLDIDGVLNSRNTKNPRGFPYVVDSSLVTKLKSILRLTQAEVVLTSTWRYDPAGLFSAEFYGIPFIDVTPDLPHRPRRNEILIWLKKYPAVERFAVIDDEDDELDGLPLFQPSAATGLTQPMARGIVRYLNGKTDCDMRASAVTRLVENLQAVLKRHPG
jgi:hypothetical protein